MFRSFGRNWFEYGQQGETFTIGDRSLNGNETNYMYSNEGGGRFVNVAWAVGTASRRDGRGTAIADFDHDGDLDIFLTNNKDVSQYFQNDVARGNWLQLELRGKDSNSHGIGSRLRLVADGKAQVREVRTGVGYLSSPPTRVHFGVGPATTIDRVEIRWPSGALQVLEHLKANQIVVVDEGGGVSPIE